MWAGTSRLEKDMLGPLARNPPFSVALAGFHVGLCAVVILPDLVFLLSLLWVPVVIACTFMYLSPSSPGLV